MTFSRWPIYSVSVAGCFDVRPPEPCRVAMEWEEHRPVPECPSARIAAPPATAMSAVAPPRRVHRAGQVYEKHARHSRRSPPEGRVARRRRCSLPPPLPRARKSRFRGPGSGDGRREAFIWSGLVVTRDEVVLDPEQLLEGENRARLGVPLKAEREDRRGQRRRHESHLGIQYDRAPRSTFAATPRRPPRHPFASIPCVAQSRGT